MPNDVEECDAAGPALRRVHPVSGPGIFDRIPVAPVPDVETIQRVECDRQPDPEQLKEEHERKIAQKAYLSGIGIWAADRGGIGNENVLEEKRAHGNDTRKRMQAAQKKRRALASAQRRHVVHRTFRHTFRYPGSSRTGC
jgi:hypothetical protein